MSAALPFPGDSSAPDSTIFAATLLTTLRKRSNVFNVAQYREVTLLLDIDGGSTANVVSIIPLMAAEGDAEPATTDDVWFIPAIYDGAVSAALPSGTAATNSTFTLAPEFGQITVRPTEIVFENTDAATDEIRIAVTLKCAWARWFHLQIADNDSAGTKSTVSVKLVGSS